jgi:hypothetical protein
MEAVGLRDRVAEIRRSAPWRWFTNVAFWLVVFAVIFVACAPMLRGLGFLPNLGKRELASWQVVRVAPDRRSAVIRVDVCGKRFSGFRVIRAERNVRLAVFVRAELDDVKRSCAALDGMPTRVVKFGFALPTGGRILESGCREKVCTDPVPTTSRD